VNVGAADEPRRLDPFADDVELAIKL